MQMNLSLIYAPNHFCSSTSVICTYTTLRLFVSAKAGEMKIRSQVFASMSILSPVIQANGNPNRN